MRVRIFFLQNSTLGYMTKTLNQIIIFFLHQNQNIFFSNIENQNTMTDVAHTNDTAVTSFEWNLKCRNFYDIEFSQKSTTRLSLSSTFFKIFIIPYLFYFFCSLFFFQHADVHATACWRIGSYAPDNLFVAST